MTDITISNHHIYRVDGVITHSVTQLIDKAGYIDKQWFTPEAAERGIRIHRLCEAYCWGTLDEEKLSAKDRGYIEAFKKFYLYCRPRWDIDGIEQTFYNDKYDYCGTRDRVGGLVWGGHFIDGVLDIKTGIPQAWHGIQLAGYNIDHEFSRHRFGLYLSKDGKYNLKMYDDIGDYQKFLACVELYNK